MKKRWKKWILLLAASAVLTAGCAKTQGDAGVQEKGTQSQENDQGAERKETQAESAQEGGGDGSSADDGGDIGVIGSVAAAEGSGGAMGRYVETKLTLPWSSTDSAGLFLDMARLRDGTLRIAVNGEDELAIWDSADGGENWEQTLSLPEEYEGLYYVALALSPDGGGAGLAMTVSDGGEGAVEGSVGSGMSTEAAGETGSEETAAAGRQPEYSYSFVSFDAEGNARSTPYEDKRMFHMDFSGDGRLICMGSSGAWLMDRETGGILQEFPGEDTRMIGVCGKELLRVSAYDVTRYDLDSGEPLGQEEALTAALFSDGRSYGLPVFGENPLVFAEDEDGRLYYAVRDGICSCVPGSGVVEQIVDGTLVSLADPACTPQALEAADGEFYIASGSNQVLTGLLRYTYDPEISSTPEKELTVYSLKESAGIRQAAAQFQKDHPDTYVNYQIGLDGGNGMTAADALRTLNTDILAENGPDVLVLDGMSVDTYASRGLLADLGGILEELREEEGLIEKIACTYQTGELIPAVPVRFGIPLAVGSETDLEQMTDLSSLAKLGENPEFFDSVNVFYIATALYPTCAGSWKQEDGTLDADALRVYVDSVRKIYENFATSSEENREILGNLQDTYQAALEEGLTNGFSVWDLGGLLGVTMYSSLSGEQKAGVGLLTRMFEMSEILSCIRVTGEGAVKVFGGQQENVFVPGCTVGILSTAREPERAGEFVKYLLSAEGELANKDAGFPVNRTAFEQTVREPSFKGGEESVSVSSVGEDDSYTEMVIYWPTEDEQNWLLEAAESLDTRADLEEVQFETVIEETRRCMLGEIGVDEAVNSIMQKINLYLAE